MQVNSSDVEPYLLRVSRTIYVHVCVNDMKCVMKSLKTDDTCITHDKKKKRKSMKSVNDSHIGNFVSEFKVSLSE